MNHHQWWFTIGHISNLSIPTLSFSLLYFVNLTKSSVSYFTSIDYKITILTIWDDKYQETLFDIPVNHRATSFSSVKVKKFKRAIVKESNKVRNFLWFLYKILYNYFCTTSSKYIRYTRVSIRLMKLSWVSQVLITVRLLVLNRLFSYFVFLHISKAAAL